MTLILNQSIDILTRICTQINEDLLFSSDNVTNVLISDVKSCVITFFCPFRHDSKVLSRFPLWRFHEKQKASCEHVELHQNIHFPEKNSLFSPVRAPTRAEHDTIGAAACQSLTRTKGRSGVKGQRWQEEM